MIAGVPVHVVHRGNNKQVCFRADRDRQFYLLHLARLLREEDCRLHAFCLMTNHVHLLLTAGQPTGCARLMQRISLLYTQYVNKTYQQCGTLWEGRFHSSLVESDAYVLACYRYIDCNPVRARLVLDPADYEWSSYKINAKGLRSDFVDPHEEYERLGKTAFARQAAYEELVAQGLGAEVLRKIRESSSGNFPLGSAAFSSKIAATLGRRAVRGKPGRPRKRDEAERAAQPGLLGAENVVCP